MIIICTHCAEPIEERDLDTGHGAVWVDGKTASYCYDDDAGPRHEPHGGSTVTVSLRIENCYELYDDVTRFVTDKVLPAPGDDEEQWIEDYLFPLTGTGHTDGNSYYEIRITASSDPTLIGRVYEWGG